VAAAATGAASATKTSLAAAVGGTAGGVKALPPPVTDARASTYLPPAPEGALLPAAVAALVTMLAVASLAAANLLMTRTA
jgi:hypothetical protein